MNKKLKDAITRVQSEWDPGEWSDLDADEAKNQAFTQLLEDEALEIASQSWRCGSWSTVYELCGCFVAIDEVETYICDSAEEAFSNANIGNEDNDAIVHLKIDPRYERLDPYM
jgi:hypothetical protein